MAADLIEALLGSLASASVVDSENGGSAEAHGPLVSIRSANTPPPTGPGYAAALSRSSQETRVPKASISPRHTEATARNLDLLVRQQRYHELDTPPFESAVASPCPR